MIWLFLLTVLCYEGFLTFLYLEDKLEKFSIKNKGDFLSAIILGFLPLFNILLISAAFCITIICVPFAIGYST